MDKIGLYTYIDGINDTPFPSTEEQIVLNSFTYTSDAMGGAPSMTATAKHSKLLDDLWSSKVYATFKGEKLYVKNTPSTTKDNTDVRYSYDIEFLSERDELNHVYFIDAVQGDNSVDVYKSNSSKVIFMGDIHEFAKRLQSCLDYFGLDYTVEVGSTVETEDKLVSFEDKYILEALQESFSIFEIPYYFKGKTIRFDVVSEISGDFFQYNGAQGNLLSISRENANYAIINKIKGMGSTDNIPFYYPNESADREEVEASGKKWITPMQNLMPSIYRESEGANQFYEAKNDTYQNEDGEYYVFENEYSEDNQRQGTITYEDIKPSIKGAVNAAGLRMDMFSDFAFDRNDNDQLDENNEYVHSYFYGKLRKFDGEYGFNLFDQAIDGETMRFSMTSGVCGACEFELGVGEESGKNIIQVTEDGLLKYDSDGNVLTGEPQDRQNDTSKYEVWVALKKDNTTYGQIMPNAGQNLKPSTNDTFVILGIRMPQQYILRAEKELEKSLIKYMFLSNMEKFNFSIRFSRVYLAKNPDVEEQINENAALRVVYNDKEYILNVTSYSYKMDSSSPLPEISVELSDTLTIGKNSLNNRLDALKQDVLSSIGGNADLLKTAMKYFLRKDAADTARGLITFLKGIRFGKTDLSISEEGVATLLSAIFNNGKAKIDSDGAAKFLSVLLGTGIETENFSTGALGTGFCLKKDENGDTYLEVDRALFRKSATFIEVLIQSLRYVGGQIILSPASMSCSLVEDKDTFYRCYFNNTDGDKTIKQEFVVGDQARSQTFNIKEGVSHNVSNTYYWRLVVGVGDDYIDLSKSDCDAGSTVPSAGDDIVQLGNRTDPTRQAAIVLAAYGNDAPYIKMYKGINSYVMDGKEFFTASRSGVRINSDMFMLSTQNGNQSVDGMIKNAVDGIVISGVNILPDSDNGFLSNLKVWPDNASKYSYTNNNGWRRINLLAGNFTGDQIVQEKYITTETGRDLTFSVLVRTNGTITSKPCFRFRDRNTVHSKDVTAIIESRGQNTYRLWATCSGGLSDNLLVFQIMNFATSGASYVEFRYPQLEYGNKPTEWRESPADLGAKLQVLDDRITAEVHSLEVANRNLLVGSDISLLGKAQGYKIGSEWYVTPHKTDDGWWRINCPNGITDGEFFIEETVSLLQNLTYTESIEMRSDSNVTAGLQFYSIYGTYPVSQAQQVSLGSNHWRLIASFKVLYNAGVRKIDVAHISAPKATYVEFRFPMLTEGERYIPWQPALEDETDTRTYLTKHDSEINQLSNEITLRVTKTEYDQNNNEIGKKFSEIRQTAESISLKVDESIGGINLIDNSSFSKNLSGWNINDSTNTIASIINNTTLGGPCLLLSTKKTHAGIFRALSDQGKCYIKEGAVFTTSFDLYKESSLPSRLRVGMEDKGLTDENILDISGHPISTWKRVSVTQTMKSTSASFIIYAMSDQMSNIYIKDLKVERGSIATPWIESENERLLSTGIDILNRKMIFTADSTIIQSNKGKTIAMFKEMPDGTPLVKAENIDVDNLRVKHLDGADGTFSGSLNAATGTFKGTLGAGCVTSNDAKIGGFTIRDNVMRSDILNAGISFSNGELSNLFLNRMYKQSIWVDDGINNYHPTEKEFTIRTNRTCDMSIPGAGTNLFIADVMNLKYKTMIKSGRYGLQYAMMGSGHIVQDGVVDGGCWYSPGFTANNQVHIITPFDQGNRICVTTEYTGDILVFPTLDKLLQMLGIGVATRVGTQFSFALTIINASSKTVYVMGKANFTVGDVSFNFDQYPTFYNTTGTLMNSENGFALAAHRSRQFILTYDGTNYKAFEL